MQIRYGNVTSGVLSSVHKSRSVVKCFLGVRRNRFKSCPFVSPSGKVLRLVTSIQTSSVGVVLLVTSHRARLVNSLSRSEARESAHPEQCGSFVLFLRALCEVRDLLIGNIRELVTFPATEIRQKQHSDLVKTFISLSFDIEELY